MQFTTSRARLGRPCLTIEPTTANRSPGEARPCATHRGPPHARASTTPAVDHSRRPVSTHPGEILAGYLHRDGIQVPTVFSTQGRTDLRSASLLRLDREGAFPPRCPAKPVGSFTTGDRASRRAVLLGHQPTRPCLAQKEHEHVELEAMMSIALGTRTAGRKVAARTSAHVRASRRWSDRREAGGI